jgi:hypothetical protein
MQFSQADIIMWTPSGKAFNVVVNRKELLARILPTTLRALVPSFTRKLCTLGLLFVHRRRRSWRHHKYFQKDRKLSLAEKMTCIKEVLK